MGAQGGGAGPVCVWWRVGSPGAQQVLGSQSAPGSVAGVCGEPVGDWCAVWAAGKEAIWHKRRRRGLSVCPSRSSVASLDLGLGCARGGCISEWFRGTSSTQVLSVSPSERPLGFQVPSGP